MFAALIVLAWLAVGIALMVAGVAAIDLLTPGKLRVQIGRSVNAAVLVASKLVAVAMIVVVAILTAPDALLTGVMSAGIYGLVGIAAMAVAFRVIDRLSPDDLANLVNDEVFHVSMIVVAAANVGLGAVVAAAIS